MYVYGGVLFDVQQSQRSLEGGSGKGRGLFQSKEWRERMETRRASASAEHPTPAPLTRLQSDRTVQKQAWADAAAKAANNKKQ